jgi:hypothetical protein
MTDVTIQALVNWGNKEACGDTPFGSVCGSMIRGEVITIAESDEILNCAVNNVLEYLIPTAYETMILGSDPGLYWRLNGSTDDPTDTSGHGLSGTQGGAGTVTPEQPGLITTGTSYEFDNAYVVTAPSSLLVINGDLTFEWWAMFPDTPASVMIPISIQTDDCGNRIVLLDDSLTLLSYSDFQGAQADIYFATLLLDTTYHFVVTYRASDHRVEFFANGVSLGSAVTVGTDPMDLCGMPSLYFGAGTFGADSWIGDEVAIYSQVLTPATIQLHYLAGIQ